MATLAMIVVLLALMVLRVPVCAAMGLSAITGLLMLDMPLNTLAENNLCPGSDALSKLNASLR